MIKLLILANVYYAAKPKYILRPEIKPYLYEDYFDSKHFSSRLSNLIKQEKESDQAKPDWSTYSSVRCGLEADRHTNLVGKCKYRNAIEKLECYYEATQTSSACYDDILYWRDHLSAFDQCDNADNEVDCNTPENSVLLCDSWGAEITDRFQMEGTAEKITLFDDSRFKQVQIYEWGLRQQCESTTVGNFTGAYYLIEPTGWFQIDNPAQEREDPILDAWTPLFKKRSNQERGVCMPSSCSLDEVMLLVSPIKVDDVVSDSLIRVKIESNQRQHSANVVLGIWDTKTRPVRAYFTQIWQFTDAVSRAYGPSLWSFVSVISTLIVITLSTSFYRRHFGELHPWLVSFDLAQNWRTLTDTSTNSKMIECLSGVRVFSTLLIMYGHTYVEVMMRVGTVKNRPQWERYDVYNDMILPGFDLAVDSFFVMGGITTAYVVTDRVMTIICNIDRGCFLSLESCVRYLMHYLNRWFRLTPVMMVAMWFSTNVMPAFGGGPGTRFNTPTSNCSMEWHYAIFYMHTWLNSQSCNGEIWYLANEFWYYLAFPIYAAFYAKSNVAGHLVTLLFTIGSILSNAYVTWRYDQGVKHQLNAVGPGRSLPMFYQEINAHNETGANVRGQMWMDDYHGMFARFHSYGIGILAGWAIKECRRIKWSITLPANYFLCCIGWLVAFGLLFVSYFGAQIWHKPVLNGTKFDFTHVILNTREKVTAWNACCRALWSSGLALLIFICDRGGGYMINEFLSSSAFKVLGRLTYIVYLFHFTIVKLMWRYTEQPIFATKSNHIQSYVFVAVTSFALAVLVHLTVELPFAGLWGRVNKYLNEKIKRIFDSEKAEIAIEKKETIL